MEPLEYLPIPESFPTARTVRMSGWYASKDGTQVALIGERGKFIIRVANRRPTPQEQAAEERYECAASMLADENPILSKDALQREYLAACKELKNLDHPWSRAGGVACGL